MSSQPSESLFGPSFEPEPVALERLVLRDVLETFERRLITTVLLAAGGNQKRAAEALGVLPTTFQEKLKRFGIVHQRLGRRARGGARPSVRGDSRRPRPEAPNTPPEDVPK